MRLRRVIGVVLALVLVVVVVAAGALVWITVRAFPQTTGTVRIAGLDGPASVVRDANGIAHIRAATPHDLFLAQGFVHAQERLWQMEVWRHISAGRLSELFGESQLDTDRFIRTLGWRPAAERDLAAMAPEAVAVLEAYAEGVNAYLEAQRGALGLPWLVAGADPEPWTVLDSLAWQKVQAWNLGSNFEDELFRYLADAQLGDPARTDELFPPYREDAPIITDSSVLGASPSADTEGAGAADGEPDSFPRPTADQAAAWRSVAALGGRGLELAGLDRADGLAGGDGIGSNNWVVAPDLSVTGGALLANDPHLGISMPSIWFMNGLHCAPVTEACPYDVVGVSFPGTPAVVLGHNARIAWGATNVGSDVQDLFVEELDPADPSRYLFAGEPLPFTTRVEEIRVKGGETVRHEVRETIHGPILNDVDPRLADAPPMSLRWAATVEPDRTFEAILALNTAGDFDAFRAALAWYGTPSQNFVYADVDGHIGYQLPGYAPIRSGDPRGDRPRPGAAGTHEWGGRVPYEELPWQLDPPDGWIVSANNAPVDEGYPYHLGSEWDPGYRAENVVDGLRSRAEDGLTVDDMIDLQLDTEPRRSREIAARLFDAAPSTEAGRAVLDLILEWDGRCIEESRGCAAWSAWEYRLLRRIFDDDLGPLARDWVGSPMSWVVLERLFDETDAGWWDDVTTPGRESAAELMDRALDEAGTELEAALGAADGWTWGRLHTVTFREDTLGSSGIGPLEWYMNAQRRPAPGAAGAINNTYYRFSRAYPDPDDPEFVPVGLGDVFAVTNLPSYRLVIDMSDLDAARIVTTTGQGGNPFGPHYGDLIEAWRTGAWVPLPFTSAAIDAAAVDALELVP